MFTAVNADPALGAVRIGSVIDPARMAKLLAELDCDVRWIDGNRWPMHGCSRGGGRRAHVRYADPDLRLLPLHLQEAAPVLQTSARRPMRYNDLSGVAAGRRRS